jgi:gamma-glutamylcyclotransferase (GGCT)/AIG2-like uncharacterized protein YtfP
MLASGAIAEVTDPLPHEYRRDLIPVMLDDGSQLDAWAYVLQRSPRGLQRIHSGDFVEWYKSSKRSQ